MTSDDKDTFGCEGCSKAFVEGNKVFGIEIGMVKSDGVVMLPLLQDLFCKDCAETELNMSHWDVSRAVRALEAHLAEHR